MELAMNVTTDLRRKVESFLMSREKAQSENADQRQRPIFCFLISAIWWSSRSAIKNRLQALASKTDDHFAVLFRFHALWQLLETDRLVTGGRAAQTKNGHLETGEGRTVTGLLTGCTFDSSTRISLIYEQSSSTAETERPQTEIAIRLTLVQKD